MGDDDDRAPVRVQFRQDGQHFLAAAAVQGAGRLVRQDDAGVVHQRAGDGHALLLAARQGRRAVVQPRAHAQPVQKRCCPRAARECGLAPVDGGDFDVAKRGQFRQQVIPLEDEAKAFAPQRRQLGIVQRADVLARETVGAGAGPVQAAQDVHQRGLARPGRPHDRHEFAGRDGQVHVAQNGQRALALGIAAPDAGQLDDRLVHRDQPRIPRGIPASGPREGLSPPVPVTIFSPSARPSVISAMTLSFRPTLTTRSDKVPSLPSTCRR